MIVRGLEGKKTFVAIFEAPFVTFSQPLHVMQHNNIGTVDMKQLQMATTKFINNSLPLNSRKLYITYISAIISCKKQPFSSQSHQGQEGNTFSQDHINPKSKERNKKYYAKHFKTLELSDDSNRETVRQQYIGLVKKYHPDTARNAADSSYDKFYQIDEAYKELQKLFAVQAQEEKDCEGEYGLYYKVGF